MENNKLFFEHMHKLPASFDEYLLRFAQEAGDLANSYIPFSDNEDTNRYLYAPLLRYSENGGKRHRPLICFLACLAVGGELSHAARSASAFEHFHSAALIHDDVEDEADLRRGMPCMHKVEGIPLAINMGDLALSLVNSTVLEDPLLNDSEKVRVVSEMCTMARLTIEGQALDIGWARDNRFDITEEDYLFMASHKTAFYSGAVPLAVGAIIGGASEQQIESLRQFGFEAGLAFQIQDDLLNVIGTEESTKKDFRNDITEGKRTLMVVHSLQHSSPENRQELIDILSSHTSDPATLARAVEILQESDSVRYAKDFAANLSHQAKSRILETIEPSAARDVLVSMADWFVRRLG